MVLKKYKCSNGDITVKKSELDKQVGESQDVLCVANNKKKLAALDFSTYGISKYRKNNKKLINKIIDYANTNNVKYLNINKKGGVYLKTVFFKEKNYKDALKLINLIWNPKIELYFPLVSNNILPLVLQVAIGILSGYEKKIIFENIIRIYNFKFYNEKLVYNNVKNALKTMKITLDDINKFEKCTKFDKIKNI
jgi:hypothetical protein